MTETNRPFRAVPTPQSRIATASPSTVPDSGSAAPVVLPPRLDPRAAAADLPPERGGYTGPEPTRFGDWEHKGRCTDF